MSGKYVCGICGEIYDNLAEYVKCVNKCSDLVAKEAEDRAEKERLAKLNAEIAEVKKAKDIIAKFKNEHPEEYKLNFGECSCGKHKESCGTHSAQPTKAEKNIIKKNATEKNEPAIETVELFFEDDGNGKTKMRGKINGKEADFKDVMKKANNIPQNDVFNWIMGDLF